MRSVLSKRLIALITLCLALAEAPASAEPRLVAPPQRAFNWGYVMGLPREDAITLALLPDYAQFRPGILNMVFRMWAAEDPVAAHHRLRSLEGDVDTGLIEVQVIEHWLRTDPHAAIAAAAAADDAQTLELAFRSYAHLDSVAALAAAQEYDARLGEPGWIGVLEGVASSNHELAAEHVASLGGEGEHLIATFIPAFAIDDPGKAMDWLLAYFPRHTEHYASIASFFYVQDPPEAFAYLARMAQGASRDAFAVALCQAKSVNEASRAVSGLEQRPYDASACDP